MHLAAFYRVATLTGLISAERLHPSGNHLVIVCLASLGSN